METRQNFIVKIIVFLLTGLIFAVSMIAYSKARTERGGRFVEGFNTDFSSEWDTDKSNESPRRIQRLFDVKPGGKLSIRTDGGAVTVETWDKPQVVVNVEATGDPDDLNRFKLSFDADDSTVTVIGKGKRSRFFPWHWGRWDVRFHARVPSSFDVSARTAGGDVDIRGVQGKVRGGTSGGDIRLSSLTGEVFGETSGGDVIITGIKGDVKASTSGGNIKVDSVEGSVKVQTSGGDVVILNVEGKIHGETSGGDIEGGLVGENQGIHLGTSGGNVTLYVPKSVVATVDASTSGGSVKCDLPILVTGKTGDHELKGKINGGGNLVNLSTSGGNIRIRGRD